MDPPKSFLFVPRFSAVDWPKKCPGAEMSPLRQAGRRDDCSGALADAATTEDMVLAEQRSEAALPQAVPGPSLLPGKQWQLLRRHSRQTWMVKETSAGI